MYRNELNYLLKILNFLEETQFYTHDNMMAIKNIKLDILLKLTLLIMMSLLKITYTLYLTFPTYQISFSSVYPIPFTVLIYGNDIFFLIFFICASTILVSP